MAVDTSAIASDAGMCTGPRLIVVKGPDGTRGSPSTRSADRRRPTTRPSRGIGGIDSSKYLLIL
jgi:hypothetical protein